MKYIDLFCGIGSFHFAMDLFDHECVFACDIDKDARSTYETNYHIRPEGDIRDIDLNDVPEYDVLTAGFPCIPFSTIGKQKGFADKDGGMFFEVMRFVKHHKPRFVVLENVPGLITHNSGETFATILSSLTAEGYNVSHKVLNSKDYGIPQSRRRVFIVGCLDTPVKLDFKPGTPTNLTEYLNVGEFERETSHTIRCQGRYSKYEDKTHNWSHYMVNDRIYQLKIEDALRLQGFPSKFPLSGSKTQQWRQIGNSIPTNLTQLVVGAISNV